jgi:hypothetical protein
MWLNWGVEGKVYANWVGELVWRRGGMRTGREGRMRPNMVGGESWEEILVDKNRIEALVLHVNDRRTSSSY